MLKRMHCLRTLSIGGYYFQSLGSTRHPVREQEALASQLPSPSAGLEGWNQMDASFNKITIERRSKARYPVELTVRYRTVARNQRVNGVGHTLNMSSGGLLVYAQHEISTGLRLEVNVEWPLLLDGAVPLQLVAHGKVVRCGGSMFAVAFAQYQFRTMGRIAKSTDDLDSDPMARLANRMAGA
jgi:PilZ domain